MLSKFFKHMMWTTPIFFLILYLIFQHMHEVDTKQDVQTTSVEKAILRQNLDMDNEEQGFISPKSARYKSLESDKKRTINDIKVIVDREKKQRKILKEAEKNSKMSLDSMSSALTASDKKKL